MIERTSLQYNSVRAKMLRRKIILEMLQPDRDAIEAVDDEDYCRRLSARNERLERMKKEVLNNLKPLPMIVE